MGRKKITEEQRIGVLIREWRGCYALIKLVMQFGVGKTLFKEEGGFITGMKDLFSDMNRVERAMAGHDKADLIKAHGDYDRATGCPPSRQSKGKDLFLIVK